MIENVVHTWPLVLLVVLVLLKHKFDPHNNAFRTRPRWRAPVIDINEWRRIAHARRK